MATNRALAALHRASAHAATAAEYVRAETRYALVAEAAYAHRTADEAADGARRAGPGTPERAARLARLDAALGALDAVRRIGARLGLDPHTLDAEGREAADAEGGGA